MDNDHWCVIGSAQNDETQEMIKYIKQKTGIEPKFFALYSTMMAFIRHSGLNENCPVAYHNGYLVAEGLKDLKVDFATIEEGKFN